MSFSVVRIGKSNISYVAFYSEQAFYEISLELKQLDVEYANPL